MISNIIPLVDWGMGTALIAVFAIVCVVLVLVILNLMNSDKKKNEE
jgi:hypothetical protein